MYNFLDETKMIQTKEEKKYFSFRNNQNIECFFKTLDDKKAFIELLSSEIAARLKLDHVEYKKASIRVSGEYLTGVYSESFKKEGFKYIEGDALFDEFGVDSSKTYNLYIIWQIIEKKFKNYPNFEKQMETLMDNLVNTMIFDLVILYFNLCGCIWCVEFNI